MPVKAILHEAEQLKTVSQRLEILANEHAPVTEALLRISGTILSSATLLEVLVATRLGEAGPN